MDASPFPPAQAGGGVPAAAGSTLYRAHRALNDGRGDESRGQGDERRAKRKRGGVAAGDAGAERGDASDGKRKRRPRRRDRERRKRDGGRGSGPGEAPVGAPAPRASAAAASPFLPPASATPAGDRAENGRAGPGDAPAQGDRSHDRNGQSASNKKRQKIDDGKTAGDQSNRQNGKSASRKKKREKPGQASSNGGCTKTNPQHDQSDGQKQGRR